MGAERTPETFFAPRLKLPFPQEAVAWRVSGLFRVLPAPFVACLQGSQKNGEKDCRGKKIEEGLYDNVFAVCA